MKLYTISYAGGFAFTFLKWKKFLDPSINLYPTELTGRGSKINEPLCETIEEMAESILSQISNSEQDYVLFGHSMGALVILEIYRKLKKRGQNLPKKVLLSGMKPPHLYVRRNYHLLDEERFKDKLFEMGGIPKEITTDEEFTNHLFYLLRNDFKAVESYQYTDNLPIFDCPVTVFNSEADIARETMKEWALYTNHSFEYYQFEGTHFFINENTRTVVQIINNILCMEPRIQ